MKELGVAVFEGVEVLDLVASERSVDRIRTSRGEFGADAIVLACGASTPALARSAGLRLPIAAGKGYSFDLRPSWMPRRPILIADAHLAVAPLDGRVRIAGTMELGGADLHVDQRRITPMERAARGLFGDWDPVGTPWAGLRPIAPDGLPVIGPAPGQANLYLATGYSMLGMTVSPAAGELLADAITTGASPPTLRPFAPQRFARRR